MPLQVPTGGDQQPHSRAASPVYISTSGESFDFSSLPAHSNWNVIPDDDYKKLKAAVIATFNEFKKLVDPNAIHWVATGSALEMQYNTDVISTDAEVCVATDHIEQVTKMLTVPGSGFTSVVEERSPTSHVFTHGNNPWVVDQSIPVPLVPSYLLGCLKIYSKNIVLKRHLHRLLKHGALGFKETELIFGGYAMEG